MAEEEPRCPIHPEVRLRRRHGLVELGEGDRWVAREYGCPVRGCTHRRPRLFIEPTAWQRKNWEALMADPRPLYKERWPDIIDRQEASPPRPRPVVEPRPLEELPWRRWVELAPTDIVFPRWGRFHRATCRSLLGGRHPGLALEDAAVQQRLVPCHKCFTLRDPNPRPDAEEPEEPEDELDEYGFSTGKPWSRNR